MNHQGDRDSHEFLDEVMRSSSTSNEDRHAVIASGDLEDLSSHMLTRHASDLAAANDGDYCDKLSRPLLIDLDISTNILNDSSGSRKRSHDLVRSFETYSDSRDTDAMPRLGLSSSSSSNSADDGQHQGTE